MITLRQLRLLSLAVSEAEGWRGSLVGAAPDHVLERFDDQIKRMREAVKAARKDRELLIKFKEKEPWLFQGWEQEL